MHILGSGLKRRSMALSQSNRVLAFPHNVVRGICEWICEWMVRSQTSRGAFVAPPLLAGSFGYLSLVLALLPPPGPGTICRHSSLRSPCRLVIHCQLPSRPPRTLSVHLVISPLY